MTTVTTALKGSTNWLQSRIFVNEMFWKAAGRTFGRRRERREEGDVAGAERGKLKGKSKFGPAQSQGVQLDHVSSVVE